MARSVSGNKPNSKADYRTVAAIAAAKRLDPAWLAELGIADVAGGGIEIPYFAEDGQELFRRARGRPGTPRFQQPAGVSLRLYGLWRLDFCRQNGHAFLCEGESDAWALWDAKQPALGVPGANAANAIGSEDLEGLDELFLLPDNDAAGEWFVTSVAKRSAAGETDAAGRRRRLGKVRHLAVDSAGFFGLFGLFGRNQRKTGGSDRP